MREPRERVDDQHHVVALLGPAPGALERQLGDRHLLARVRCRRSRSRTRPPLRASRHAVASSGRSSTSSTISSTSPAVADAARDAAQQRRAAGPRRRLRTSTRCPIGERGEQVDGASQHVAGIGVERDPPLGQDRGQLVEVRAASPGQRLVAVDRVDVDERAVALAAARLARRPGDLVAGAQLAAADLRGRDVDVAGSGASPPRRRKPNRCGITSSTPVTSSVACLRLAGPGGVLVDGLVLLAGEERALDATSATSSSASAAGAALSRAGVASSPPRSSISRTSSSRRSLR